MTRSDGFIIGRTDNRRARTQETINQLIFNNALVLYLGL